jgi:GTPase SAR1 family protein
MTNMKLASETECTVVVAGDSRVGKTAIIQRFVNKTFQQVRHHFKVCFKQKYLQHDCLVSFLSLINRFVDNKTFQQVRHQFKVSF